jgi:hypothetical protein
MPSLHSILYALSCLLAVPLGGALGFLLYKLTGPSLAQRVRED